MIDPKSGSRIDEIQAVIEDLERRMVPRSEDLDRLVLTALRLYTPALADRGRALIGRWKATGCVDPDLSLAESLLVVAGASATVEHRLRALGDVSAAEAAAGAIGHVFRGETLAAADLARAHGWFLDDVNLTEPLGLVLVAVALDGMTAEAEVILRAWHRRWSGAAADKVVSALQTEARVAYFQQQYTRELVLSQDAWSLAGSSGLAAARMFIEPGLAGALLHCGEREQAEQMMGAWEPPEEAVPSPLQAMRDMVRVDLGLLDGRFDDAWAAGTRYLRFGEAMQNVPLVAEARWYRVLSARPDEFEDELTSYRRMAYRHQLRRHLDRLRTVEQLVDSGHLDLRSAMVAVRDRRGAARHPLFRLWLPPLEWVGADLYVDRVRSQVHLGGKGPASLAARPVLQQLLETLLAAPDHALTTEELFGRVWDERYDPLVHEGRVHVNAHRLRQWLRDLGSRFDSLIVVRDGVVRLAPQADVCVIELDARAASRPRAGQVRDRILQCLGDREIAPGELQQRLGVSRSSINRTLRVLLAQGRIVRFGAGRSTRYGLDGGGE
jgi:hypothetical protein